MIEDVEDFDFDDQEFNRFIVPDDEIQLFLD